MSEIGSYNSGLRLDMKQILMEARHRWLRPAEICEILRNYQKFHISAEAPNKPVSGSIFLFDRKVLRYFRKDGHNWRKKKDGKTVKEAHEKLKVGSVDMLHCYYAHGEDNEHFQRRSYWLLESDLMHVVFVHYLDVKGNKMNIGSVTKIDPAVSNSQVNTSLSSSFHGTSPSSTLSSAYEDAESGLSTEDNHQASSRVHSHPESPLIDESYCAQSSSYRPLSNPDGDLSGGSFISGAQATVNLASWQEVLQNCSAGRVGEVAYRQEDSCSPTVQANWESHTKNQNLVLNLPHDHENNLFEKSLPSNQENYVEPFYMLPNKQEQFEQRNLQMLLLDTGNATNPDLESFITTIGDENYPFLPKKPLISGLHNDESLKKVDSFSRWIAKELGETNELNLQSSSGMSWSIIGSDYETSMPLQLQEDTDTLNPSVSQDQLFSIYEFSPNWAYANLETKVLITGIFLKSEHSLSNVRWSIMFGQVEVAAEVLADGILCCRAPPHKAGPVPFYVTCSNRLSCSEVREFEYRLLPDESMGSRVVHGDSAFVMHLCHRFETILSLEPISSHVSNDENDFEKQNVISKIVSLKEESNRERQLTSENGTSELKVIGELLLEKQLKEKFFSWLLHGVTEYGKGLTVLDEGGQGVLHLAASLGFDWALKPIIVSGISIDFRDVNGWTALHWAACYGREDTVAALVSLGASPGLLTDPSTEYPLGRTPADLASCSGHKGISGFLAETSLTTHLSTLGVTDPQEGGSTEVSQVKAIQTVSERLAVPTMEEDLPDTLSLKDSLAAVCNATQAAARIHQIFRIQSFQRKQFTELDGDELLIQHEQAVSFLAAKTSRLGHSSGTTNAAAVHIQKKFRGWKKRKEFLCIREKVVKIQAHFRGHQVRKKYKPIVWSVGILEKVILRWRRKGSGLRGFRSDAVLKGPDMQGTVPQEDDYDFLKEGRKQTEERMQKALSRVKSMAQYPEARAQYRRLLTAAEGFRETKDAPAATPENFEDIIYTEEELIDVESLLDDDTFMSLAFE